MKTQYSIKKVDLDEDLKAALDLSVHSFYPKSATTTIAQKLVIRHGIVYQLINMITIEKYQDYD